MRDFLNRLRNILSAPKAAFFDWLSLDSQPCHSYGGSVKHSRLPAIGIEVRLCTKSRWHIDSHAYEYVHYEYEWRC